MGGQRKSGVADQRAELEALSVLSGKWNPVVALTLLEEGPLGFNELLETIADVSGKVLTETLADLEDRGVVERRVTSETPLRVEYDLTPAGRELRPVFESLGAWGRTHLEPTRPTVLVAGADRRLTEMYGQWLSEYYTVVRGAGAGDLETDPSEPVDVALVAADLAGTSPARLLERLRSHCRTVLLVGDSPGIDVRELPCDAVLRKPVVRSTVLEAVDEQLSRRGESEEERAEAALAAKRSLLGFDRPDGGPDAGLAGVEERPERESAGDG